MSSSPFSEVRLYTRFYDATLGKDEASSLSWTDFTHLARRRGLLPPERSGLPRRRKSSVRSLGYCRKDRGAVEQSVGRRAFLGRPAIDAERHIFSASLDGAIVQSTLVKLYGDHSRLVLARGWRAAN